MTSSLEVALKNDHARLRKMATELLTNCGLNADDSSDCFRRFRDLKAFFTAQSKAEEYVIYARVEEAPNGGQVEMLEMVFEGYEEHDVADRVFKDLVQAEELSLAWKAKLRVLAELISHHVEKEETHFFATVLGGLSGEQLLKLDGDYRHERDEIFAKKRSGSRRPALSEFSSQLTDM